SRLARRHCRCACRAPQSAAVRARAGGSVDQAGASARQCGCIGPPTRGKSAGELEQVIRVLIFLVLVGALALGAVWLAERPGDVAITWLGHRIETSVMVLIIAVTVIAVLAATLWSGFGALWRSPGAWRGHLHRRRGARGYGAVSQGLIAVGSGDLIAARRFAAHADRIAPSEPLTLLLRAQTAQLEGDRATAARSFEQMAAREETRLLGLHGLFIEARRRNDPTAALHYAEEAAKENAV